MAAETFCSTCGSRLDPGARFCSNCGSPVLSQPPYVAESKPSAPQRSVATPPPQPSVTTPPGSPERHARRYRSPGIAAFLSFLWPGIGQIYCGEVGRGIVFIIVYILAILSAAFMIGFLLVPIWWIYGIYDAYRLANRYNAELM